MDVGFAAIFQNPSATRGQTPDNPINIAYPQVVSRLASLDGIVTLGTGSTRYSIDSNGNATPFVLGSAFDNSAQTIANRATVTARTRRRPLRVDRRQAAASAKRGPCRRCRR